MTRARDAERAPSSRERERVEERERARYKCVCVCVRERQRERERERERTLSLLVKKGPRRSTVSFDICSGICGPSRAAHALTERQRRKTLKRERRELFRACAAAGTWGESCRLFCTGADAPQPVLDEHGVNRGHPLRHHPLPLSGEMIMIRARRFPSWSEMGSCGHGYGIHGGSNTELGNGLLAKRWELSERARFVTLLHKLCLE